MINHIILQGCVSCVNKWKIYYFHILGKEHKEKILQSKKMCARLVRVSLRENYYEWSKVSLLLQMHKLRRRNSIQTHRDLLSLVSGCTKDAALDSTSRGVSIIWKKTELNQICKLNTHKCPHNEQHSENRKHDKKAYCTDHSSLSLSGGGGSDKILAPKSLFQPLPWNK